MKKDDNGLSEKQKLFVKEYLIDFNGRNAAVRAGYAPKAAQVQSSRMLSMGKVAVAIKREVELLCDKIDLRVKDVVDELKKIAFSDIQNYVSVESDTGTVRTKSFDEMPPNASRAIESIQEDRVIKESADGNSTTVYDKFKFKLYDKQKALDSLGRYLNMFTDKVEVSGRNGGPIKQTLEIVVVDTKGDPDI